MAYRVDYKDHDMGAKDGFCVRGDEGEAKRSARLLRECGYRNVTVKKIEPRSTHP